MMNFPQVSSFSCKHDDDCDFMQPPCPGDTYGVCIWKTCYCIGFDQKRPPPIPTNVDRKYIVENSQYKP